MQNILTAACGPRYIHLGIQRLIQSVIRRVKIQTKNIDWVELFTKNIDQTKQIDKSLQAACWTFKIFKHSKELILYIQAQPAKKYQAAGKINKAAGNIIYRLGKCLLGYLWLRLDFTESFSLKLNEQFIKQLTEL